jgi:hypothetical protein
MMFERFTADARTVIVHAQEHSRRLGHRYIGCEHVLLAVASSGAPAGAVLREYGVTPERVEEEIVRRVGLGASASLFGDLDRDALAAVGIDLDAVRARIEATFGAEALGHAAQAFQAGPRPSRLTPSRVIPRGLRRRLRRRRAQRRMPPVHVSRPPATGRYHAPGPGPTGHIPFTSMAKKCLEITVREARARNDPAIGVEHIALGLTRVNDGPVPQILAELGTSGAAVRTRILDRYRQAS